MAHVDCLQFVIHVFTYINLLTTCIIKVSCSTNTETLSLVVNSNTLQDQDYVQIVNPPNTLLQSDWIKIEYACSSHRIIGVEVTAQINKYTKRKIFHKAWKCQPSAINKQKFVKLKFHASIAYRPDVYSRTTEYILISNSKLKTWLLDPDWWKIARRHHDAYSRSLVKVSYDVNFPAPFSRPAQNRRWPYSLISDLSVEHIPFCPYEDEVVEMVSYPAVMNGLQYGVLRSLLPYTDAVLEKTRLNMIHRPRFTVSMWVYILKYCDIHLCSIMHHMTLDSAYMTPLIFLTKQGKFHIQVALSNGKTSAAIPYFSAPKNEWFRLVLSFDITKWTLTMNVGDQALRTEYEVNEETVLDDTSGLFVFGGMDNTPSFRGYIGQASYFRNKIVDPKQIPLPSPYHPMFRLKITTRDEKCHIFTEWLRKRKIWFYDVVRAKRFKEVCFKPLLEYTRRWKNGIYPFIENNTCKAAESPLTKTHKIVDKVIKKLTNAKRQAAISDMATALFKKVIKTVEKDIGNIKKYLHVLKQSACLNNYDAMYMLSVVLSNGFFVKADPIQSQAYLMLGTLGRHRLSALALANKHQYGLDGVIYDREQAYMYYKYVADTTRDDREKHKETDVVTESVRLTDDILLREQTDEDGDVFHWLKHQAQRGVLGAQQQVARALFWGSQGLKRNMKAAIEYFRMSAESKDPVAMFDYGILLVRGQGTKKNVTEGLDHLKKSAEQKNPAAISALGWYALTYDKNITLAIQYYEEAYRYGNAEAAHALGSFHLNGHYPGRKADADLALKYFEYAAVRHSFDAGIALAWMTIKGTSKTPRNVAVAVEWARFIAEKNPSIGMALRKALHAYRNAQYTTSLLYYMLVAEAGPEIGTFNLAWLCENNIDGIVASIEKDCQWRNYNLSTLREPQFIDSYALIKMGDYHFYGCENSKDEQKAAEYYLQAAGKQDPHAIFNLGFMLEEGASIHEKIWQRMGVPKQKRKDKWEILKHVYNRCKESRKTEAYIPCSIALYRVKFLIFYEQYQLLIKISGFLLTLVLTLCSIYSILRHMKRTQNPTDEEFHVQLT